MKALLCKKYGLPSTLVLEEIPELSPTPNQVIIEIKACSVNFPDTLLIQNLYQFKPALPFSPGGEVAGVVKKIGENVQHLQVGNRVFALCGWGGFAEEVAVDAAVVFPMLPAMDFVTAASVMYNYGTSFHALKDRANLQPNETLLVLGAAGGVGLAAVELGKLMGATVIAAASSNEKLAVCKEKGADFLINYSDENLKDTLKELTNGKGVDVVYDPVGDVYAEPALRSMAWKGRYLVVGFAAGEIPKLPFNLALLKGCSIMGVFWGKFASTEPKNSLKNIQQLAEYFMAGKLRPHIHKLYSLDTAHEALEDLMNRKVRGKAVVKIGNWQEEAPKKVVPTVLEISVDEQREGKLRFKNLNALKNHVGKSLGVTAWQPISQEMIDAFAKTTHDEQWIHTDPQKAKLSPFGTTIAHGLLTLSLTPKFVYELFEVQSSTMGINYGMNKVRFLKPVPSEGKLRMRAVLKAVDDFVGNGVKVCIEATIELENETKPACIAELVSIIYE